MSLNKIISMVFLLLSLGGVSSHAAQGPSSEMDEGADGPEAVSSVSHAPLPHPDHLLFHEASLGQWIGLETQGELELRGLTQVGYDGLAGEMQGGGLAQYANLLPYGDFFGGMVRRPQELEGSRIEDSLLGLLGSVPEGHSVQILGYPSLWKPDSRMSYVVIHRESTERDAEVSLEDLTEVFHRDQTAFLIVAAKAIGREDIDPSSYIGQLNRFGKISLADCLSTLPIISINRPGFPRSFVVEQLYKEGATSPAAQMRLGAFYSQQNKKVLARQYYKQEADQGKLEAQYQFAVMCYHGQGGEVNRPMARQCFQLSADQGYKIAQHSFAVMCSEGQGGDVNLPMARQYFKLAADQGYEKAQTKFSVMCLKGEGGDVDLPMARQYFKLAADQGQLESQHQFAVMCYHGQGGEVNLPMARQYSQLAADQGHALAQDSFALMCFNGEGGDVNLPMARQYFQLAADQGHEGAQRVLLTLSSHTPHEAEARPKRGDDQDDRSPKRRRMDDRGA